MNDSVNKKYLFVH